LFLTQNTLGTLLNQSIASKKTKKKTGPKPEIKNLPELRYVFLGIFKVKEYLIITPLII
jgi:hypothetical protein